MGQYRKKPVTIEARQLTYENRDELLIWCNGFTTEHLHGINIPTLEGATYAQIDDFIIRGVKGEFYACKPDIFEMTYEEINSIS